MGVELSNIDPGPPLSQKEVSAGTDIEAILDIAKYGSRRDLVELIELTEDFASERDCKFYLYEPNDVPRLFHASGAPLRAIFGGNRSSKTYSHVLDYACQFVGEAPDSLKGLIPKRRLDPHRKLRFCMEDYPNSFVKVVWPYIQQLVPEHHVHEVVKDSGRIRAIVNKYGGFIEFMFYDQEVTKHQGSSRHSIGYDEEPPQAHRDEGLMRLVDTDGDETFSLTPISGALRYLYDEIYLKRGREVEKNYDLILDDKGKLVDAIKGEITDRRIPGGDSDVDVFFACIFDNKAIKKEAALRILKKYPKNEMTMRAKGKFIFLSGLVFPQYSDGLHVIGKEHPSYEEISNWHRSRDYTLYIALDTHPRIPHAVTFLVARADGYLFIVDELFIDANAREFVEAIKAKCRGKVPERIIIDPLANTPDPATGKCLTHSLIDEGLDNPMPATAAKDKSTGIISTQNLLTPNERGIPGIFFLEDCTYHRYEIARWSWDDWKKDTQNTKGVKQKPVDKDDHFMENLYRLVLLNPRHVEPEELEYSKPARSSQKGRSAITGY